MIRVVCGIINKDEKVFLARRAGDKKLAGFWELPGGKIESNETPQMALARELLEEFGMKVRIGEFFTKNIHRYDDFEIELLAYLCEFKNASFKLLDHDAIEWVKTSDLENWNLAAADIPIVKALIYNELNTKNQTNKK